MARDAYRVCNVGPSMMHGRLYAGEGCSRLDMGYLLLVFAVCSMLSGIFFLFLFYLTLDLGWNVCCCLLSCALNLNLLFLVLLVPVSQYVILSWYPDFAANAPAQASFCGKSRFK